MEVVCAIQATILAGAALLGSLVLVSGLRADQAADEATIRANAAKYVESYNRRDSKTMASMWSPEAVYIDDETGEKAVGHDAIAKQLDHEFAGAEDAKLTIHIDSIDFVSPNVAVEKGSAEVTYAKASDGEERIHGRACQARRQVAARSRDRCRRR